MAVSFPTPSLGDIDVRKIIKEGKVVATLIGIDQGTSFTVVTEMSGPGADGPETVRRRPYSFPDAESGLSFLAEAVTAFTYLGCEIQQQ